IRRAVPASNFPRRRPSPSKSGNTRPLASWPIGSGILVKLCSPGDALGDAVAPILFLRPFDWPSMGGADMKTKSEINNIQTDNTRGREGRFTRFLSPWRLTACQARTARFQEVMPLLVGR